MDKIVNTTRREIIGRVLPNPRGEWDLRTEYKRLDFVLYAGSGYVALVDNEDVLPGTSSETWLMIVERGEKGEKGETGNPGNLTYIGQWNEDETYYKLNIVQYNGDAWICTCDETTGVIPGYIPSEEDDDVDLNTWTPSWELMVKGVDYRFEDGEFMLLDDGQMKGVKTFTECVYDKESNARLDDILANMNKKLNFCQQMLERYSLWDKELWSKS